MYTEDNLKINKMLEKGRNIYLKQKRIFMTDDSYIMKNSIGGNSLITQEDLNQVTCLKKEQDRLEKKAEQKEDYLMRLLKSELIKEKKIMKVKEKINEKDKKIQKFLKNRNDGIKYLENERYLDHQDVQERQKLFQKIMSKQAVKPEIKLLNIEEIDFTRNDQKIRR